LNAPGDVDLYHAGNNQLHRPMYEAALRRPGVVVLHDAVLQHFFLGWLDERAYVDEFVYNYGVWHADLAHDLWRRRARSGQDPRYFEYPMVRRVAESARAVVVHNPGAAAIVRAHAPRTRVVEIPHLFVPPSHPPSLGERMRLRQRLGVPPETALFGIFGHLRESKRLMPLFRAFARLGREAVLMVAGEFASADLARAAESELRMTGVLRVPYLPESGFWRHAAAVDACVSLRYPSAGETSGITIRLMGIGRPVLVTECPETSEFPADACLRVDAGPAEEEMLATYLLWIARNRWAGEEIGRRAAAHIAARHNIDLVAGEFLKVLHDARS
jgi:glycosyltransferase involved in cell wall biosynthesis